MQSSPSIFLCCFQPCSPTDQELNDGGVLRFHSHHQTADASACPGMDVSSPLQQNPDGRKVPILTGEEQGCPSSMIFCIDRGSMIQQQVYYLHISVCCRRMQGMMELLRRHTRISLCKACVGSCVTSLFPLALGSVPRLSSTSTSSTSSVLTASCKLVLVS